MLLQVVQYYHATMKQSPEAQAYLAHRAVAHPDLIGHFKLGSANRTLGLRLADKRRVEGAQTFANGVSATSNRLTTVQHGSGTATLGYDAAGNIVSDALGTYTYSARMSAATLAGGSVQYRYNGLEQRVSKTGPASLVPSGASYYAYDEAGHLIGEYDANGVPRYETIYLGDTPVAVVKQMSSGSPATVQTQIAFIYADHIDTPRVIARSGDHAVVWRWDQAEAFGDTPANDNPNGLGSFTFNQRFPGQVFDAETGLHHNGHRDFSPATGRYVQSDPTGLEGGINTFSYVEGNPLGYVDPRGLNPAAAAAGFCFTNPLGFLICAGGAIAMSTPQGQQAAANLVNKIVDMCTPGAPDPCKGLRDQLEAHEKKLAEYLNNPLGPSDNTFILNWVVLAGNGSAASSVYEGRIRNLKGQIENFRRQLKECEAKNGKP